MSCSLYSLKEGYIGDIEGSIIGVMKGDTTIAHIEPCLKDESTSDPVSGSMLVLDQNPLIPNPN